MKKINSTSVILTAIGVFSVAIISSALLQQYKTTNQNNAAVLTSKETKGDTSSTLRQGDPPPVVALQKVFLFGGKENNTIKNDGWSFDGITWTNPLLNAQPGVWSARNEHAVQYLNNTLYLFGGNNAAGRSNEVWSSGDGIHWTALASAPWTPRYGLISTVFDNKIWVMGGYDGVWEHDVWSFDGSTWTPHPNAGWGVRGYGTALALSNQMCVIAGKKIVFGLTYNYGDIWCWNGVSTNWTQRTATVAAGVYSGTVYQNAMWVFSGSKVYSSSDTIAWAPVSTTAPFVGYSLRAFTLGKMYVVGGGTADGKIWSSSDGISWTQEFQNTTWLKRTGEALAVVPGSLGQADLTVTSLSIDSASHTGGIYFTFIFKNSGQVPMTIPATTHFALNYLPSAGAPIQIADISNLVTGVVLPGTSLTVNHRYSYNYMAVPVGPATLQVVVDSQNTIPEGDESNNTMTVTTTVTP